MSMFATLLTSPRISFELIDWLVCLFVYLLTRLLKKLSTNFHETLLLSWAWPRDKSVRFWEWSAFRSSSFSLSLAFRGPICKVNDTLTLETAHWINEVKLTSIVANQMFVDPRILVMRDIAILCNILTLQTKIYLYVEWIGSNECHFSCKMIFYFPAIWYTNIWQYFDVVSSSVSWYNCQSTVTVVIGA